MLNQPTSSDPNDQMMKDMKSLMESINQPNQQRMLTKMQNMIKAKEMEASGAGGSDRAKRDGHTAGPAASAGGGPPGGGGNPPDGRPILMPGEGGPPRAPRVDDGKIPKAIKDMAKKLLPEHDMSSWPDTTDEWVDAFVAVPEVTQAILNSVLKANNLSEKTGRDKKTKVMQLVKHHQS